MASYWTTVNALRAELGLALSQISPNAFKDVDQKFSFLGYEETDQSVDLLARPRAIRIALPEWIKYEWISHTYRAHRIKIPIEIAYPTTGTWPIAMIDDFDLITEYLRDNERTTSGVEICVHDTDAPTVTRTEKDDWVIFRFALLAIIEVSA
jgi:hypothetical protein